MSKDYRNELNEMYRLMNYGMNESKKTTANQGIVEYSQLGADGKTYGILKEGTKYYVKVAPKKNTAILAEDYDYVGGRDRRKAYDSYSKASNALNLQLISVNEACGSKQAVKSQFNLNESAEWKTAQTKEARTELNRFYQLVSRVDGLLNENVHYINENDKTYSEKPTKAPKGSTGKGGQQQPTGIKEKDWTKDNSKVNAEKDYNNYGVKGNSPSGKYDAASGVKHIDQTEGNPYQEKAKTSKEQGKSVSENRRTVKLSEEQERQITAWRRDFVHNDEEGLVDRSHGTEIGDTAPWTDNVNESFETSEWDEGLPGQPGTGDAKPYDNPFDNKSGVRQPVSETFMDNGDAMDEGIIYEVTLDDPTMMDSMSSEDEDAFDDMAYDGAFGDPEPDFGDTSYEGLADGISDDDLNGEGPDDIDSLLSDIPDTDEEGEDPISGWDDTDANSGLGSQYGMTHAWDDEPAIEQGNLDEAVLNDFGKHPAYRKKPMTLPQNADGSKWGEDWNDESTKGEQPYGRQIGHSGDPFTDVVNAITNAVVTSLAGKKKI